MVLEINIKNNKRTIELVTESNIHDLSYIYLDTYDNRKNYLSNAANDHSYKFLKSELSPVVNSSKTTYSITNTMLEVSKITGLYILTVMYDDGTSEQKIIYDETEIYCVRIKYMSKICNTCSDIASNRMLINLMFNETLFKNSIKLDLIEDAIKYYTEIYRPVCKDGMVTNSCSTGMCSI